VVSLLVVLLAAGCGNAPLRGVPLVLGTGTEAGVYSGLGEALAAEWRADGGAQVTTLRTQGSEQNLDMLLNGRADVVSCQADGAADRSGSSRRALARLHDDYIQVVVRGDTAAHRLADLRDLRVSIGTQGSGVQFVARRLLSAAGLTLDGIEPAELSTSEAAVALKDGTIDAFIWSGGVPTPRVQTLVQEMEREATPVRMLDLSDVRDQVRAKHPAVYEAAAVPSTAYPGLASPWVETLLVHNLLLTTTAMPDEQARALTEILVGSLPSLVEKTKDVLEAARQLDRRAVVETAPILLHPGAQAYYRESDDE